VVVVEQPALVVGVLAGEAQVVAEAADSGGVGVGGVGAEGVEVVPLPAHLFAAVDDLAGGAEVVAEHGVDGTTAREHGDGQVAEPEVCLLADTVVAVAAAQVVGLAVSHRPAHIQGGAGF